MESYVPISRSRRVLLRIVLIYPVLLLALSLFHTLAPQRSGLLALSQVLAPYLFMPLLLILPLTLLRGAVTLRLAIALCTVIVFVRFVPIPRLTALLHSTEPEAARTLRVEVMNWNVQNSMQLDQIARVRPVLLAHPPDVVVLEEAYWEWFGRDPELAKLYPGRLVHTRQASSGLVLLSKYPILEYEVPQVAPGGRGGPRVIMARLDAGQGRTLTVVAAHAEAPSTWIGGDGGRCQPVACYDTAQRDALTPLIRAYVEPELRRGGPLILMGDFNVTEREPAYDELARGLKDPNKAVGPSIGHTTNTWPNITVMGWQLPLLRIDHIFSSPNVTALNASVDCTPRGSDHCVVYGMFEVEIR